jgi:hypothetical protein
MLSDHSEIPRNDLAATTQQYTLPSIYSFDNIPFRDKNSDPGQVFHSGR